MIFITVEPSCDRVIRFALARPIGYRLCAFDGGSVCLIPPVAGRTHNAVMTRWENKQHVTVFLAFYIREPLNKSKVTLAFSQRRD